MIQVSYFLIIVSQFYASTQTDPYIEDPGAYPMVDSDPIVPGFKVANVRGKYYGVATPRVPFDENYCGDRGHEPFRLKSENDYVVIQKFIGMSKN